VACFIPDPTDLPPNNSKAAQWVTDHQGSVSSSWYNAVWVRGPCPPQKLYTSFDPNEMRFSSPGRFVVAVVTPPSSDAPVSIRLAWKATFSQPSFETSFEDTPTVYTLKENCRLLLSDGRASEPFDNKLYKDLADTPVAITAYDFVPPLPRTVYLQLDAPKTLNSDTGATGAPENAIVTHIGVHADHSCGYYYTTDGEKFTALKADHPFSIRPTADSLNTAGTVYEADPASPPFQDPEVVGFQQGPSRARRSVNSARPRFQRLSNGKTLTMISSERS